VNRLGPGQPAEESFDIEDGTIAEIGGTPFPRESEPCFDWYRVKPGAEAAWSDGVAASTYVAGQTHSHLSRVPAKR
jgi:hypothetical protein